MVDLAVHESNALSCGPSQSLTIQNNPSIMTQPSSRNISDADSKLSPPGGLAELSYPPNGLMLLRRFGNPLIVHLHLHTTSRSIGIPTLESQSQFLDLLQHRRNILHFKRMFIYCRYLRAESWAFFCQAITLLCERCSILYQNPAYHPPVPLAVSSAVLPSTNLTVSSRTSKSLSIISAQF